MGRTMCTVASPGSLALLLATAVAGDVVALEISQGLEEDQGLDEGEILVVNLVTSWYLVDPRTLHEDGWGKLWSSMISGWLLTLNLSWQLGGWEWWNVPNLWVICFSSIRKRGCQKMGLFTHCRKISKNANSFCRLPEGPCGDPIGYHFLQILYDLLLTKSMQHLPNKSILIPHSW